MMGLNGKYKLSCPNYPYNYESDGFLEFTKFKT